MQKLFHYNENLFSTKRKTFFNEVKIFFQLLQKVPPKYKLSLPERYKKCRFHRESAPCQGKNKTILLTETALYERAKIAERFKKNRRKVFEKL